MKIYSMIRKTDIKWRNWWFLPLAFFFILACNKNFDQPPYADGDPDIAVNSTIKDIQDLYTGTSKLISDSLVFSGIVISNDSAGNIYKQIFVEDSTGGINIQLDASNLNADYPLGSRVFVKVAGLTIGSYGGLIELGMGTSSTGQIQRIPSSVMGTYVVAGSIGHVVEPLHLTIDQLNPKYQGMLVQIDSLQFADTTATYADSTKALANVNQTLQDCSGNSVIIRSSSYASFAGTKVAKGKGNLTAIYTAYNNTNQLIIRSLADVTGLTAARCGTTGGIVASISDLRSQYTGKDLTFSMGSFDGVVVSNSSNEAANNYKIVSEDNSAGIVLYQTGLTIKQGDKVTVDLAGGTLTTYNGDLELTNVASVKTNSSGATVTPAEVTISDLMKDRLDNSTRMVKISNLTITAPASTTGNATYTLSDGTNTVSSFIRSTSGIVLTNGTATVTGYVTLYKAASSTDTTLQITIRSLDDVVYSTSGGGNTGGGTGVTSLTEDFSSITTGNNTSTSGSATAWTGNDNFPTVDRAYAAGGMVKLGTASVVGSITSKTLDLSASSGKFTVSFDVKGWAAAGVIVVTTSNGESQTVSYTNTMTGDLETHSVQFSAGIKDMTVTISTDKTAYRAFIDNVKISN